MCWLRPWREGNAKGFNEWLEVVLREMSVYVVVPLFFSSSQHCMSDRSVTACVIDATVKGRVGDKTTPDGGVMIGRLVRSTASTACR